LAIDQVENELGVSGKTKENDLERLLKIIEKQSSDWTYRRLLATDGGALFIGPAGESIAIDP
jgi:hypothetical protein